MARKKSYAKKRKTKNTKFFAMIIILTLVFVGFIYYTDSRMDAEMKQIDEDMASNKKKIKELDQEITSLEKDYDIRNTDKFKEKVAKERLGMVKKDSDEETNENVETKENIEPKNTDEEKNDDPN